MVTRSLNSLSDLLVRHTERLYDAEHRLSEMLLLVSQHVETGDVANAIQIYLEETREDIDRLQQVFAALGRDPRRRTCQVVKGAVDWCHETLDAVGNQKIKETAFLAIVQSIQNYEIGLYRSAHGVARCLSRDRAASLLQQSLEIEVSEDLRLAAVMRETLGDDAIGTNQEVSREQEG